MQIIDYGGWRFVLADDYNFGEATVGKWMFHYGASGLDFAEEMCTRAIREGVVKQAKRRDIRGPQDTGVACFYVRADDNNGHRRVLRFFLDNGLVRKTKSGRLANISFKLDEQTQAGEYGRDFVARIKLEDFVDLDTGEFRR